MTYAESRAPRGSALLDIVDARGHVALPKERDDPAMPILALVCGIARQDWHRYGLLMLEAYIDDSGRGHGPVFLLSGYVAAPEVWMQFSRDWKAELDAEPSIQYFKMKEAAGRSGQFAGHKRELIEFRLSNLVGILERHEVRGMTVAVDSEAFSRIVIPGVKNLPLPPVAKKALANPYFHCFYDLILHLLYAERDRGTIEPIDFIFDEQGKEGRIIRDYWYALRSRIPVDGVRDMLANEPIFRDDKTLFPLQAADLAAWQVRNWLTMEVNSDQGRMDLNPIMARLSAIPHLEHMMSGQKLQRRMDEFARMDWGERGDDDLDEA